MGTALYEKVTSGTSAYNKANLALRLEQLTDPKYKEKYKDGISHT
jgi:hypothetical protein